LLALARAAAKDSDVKSRAQAALDRVDWSKLDDAQRSDLLRVYTVLFSRQGKPDETGRTRFLKSFEGRYPTKNYEVNADLCQLLVYLEAPTVVEKTLPLMAKAPAQEEQMEYAKTLRNLKTGWTPAQRKDYFEWFPKAANYKGGQRFQAYINEIKQNAVATLSDEEKASLQPILAVKKAAPEVAFKPRPIVKQWTVAELAPVVEKGLTGRDFDHGRLLFGEAKCFSCHRYDNEGGALGPDLTVVSGRYSPRDFLEKILTPSKAISDQYVATVFILKDGRTVIGRVVNLQGDNMSVQTDMLSPSALTSVNVNNVESSRLSDVSPMPTGLLDSLREDEVLDLLAYALSRGNRKHEMFQISKK